MMPWMELCKVLWRNGTMHKDDALIETMILGL